MDDAPPTKDTRDKTSWNIASDQANLIKDLLRKEVSHHFRGEFKHQFFCLTMIRELVNYGLKVEERNKLDSMEEIIRQIVKHEYSLNKKVRQVVGESIKAYHREIMDILFLLGFFPSKEDRTRLHF